MLEGRRIFVAGHRGLVGSALVRRLGAVDCELLTVDRRSLDLRDPCAVRAWFLENRPDVVFMAAARVGGIVANDSRPAEFIADNLAIELSTITAAHASGVARFVFLGSSCIYPKHAEQPIRESALLSGPLEPTNQWYAVAKIAGIKLCQAYRRQYGCDFISAMPCNLYGCHDNFDPTSSHVIPALIRKAHESRMTGRDLVVWGSGRPRREFLFADDAADALILLARSYSGDAPVNVGAGADITIAELTALVCQVVGFTGRVVYDDGRPDGTPRKLMDNSVITSLGWRPATALAAGLERTYQWYLETRLEN